MTLVASAGLKATSLTLSAGLIVGSNIVSDTADTDSIGSTSKEWLNLYIGDAGKIYFGLSQDVNLYRSASDILKTDDQMVIASATSPTLQLGDGTTGSVQIGDETISKAVGTAFMFSTDITPSVANNKSLGSASLEWLNLYLGDSGVIYIGSSQDVNIYRSSANILKTDDNMIIAGGYIDVGQVRSISGQLLISGISNANSPIKFRNSNAALDNYVDRLWINAGADQGDAGIKTYEDFYPSSADTNSLGGTSNEWLNLYIGDAGKIYFGLSQDVNLYWHGENVLRTDDSFIVSSALYIGTSLVWGTALDTNLYRSAANVLQTDDSFVIGSSAKLGFHGGVTTYIQSDGTNLDIFNRPTSGSIIFSAYNSGDSKKTMTFSGEGQLQIPTIGSSGGLLIGGDVNLYRTSANLLKTDDSLEVAGMFYPYGGITLGEGDNVVLGTSTGTQIGTATNQLLGFYGVTPVDQPVTVSDPAGQANDLDSEARTAIETVIDRLQELGLIA